MTTQLKYNESIISHAIDGLDNISEGTYKSDLHHHLFNEDHFIIGYYNCSEWLKDNKIGEFEAMGIVQEYEKDHFGELTKVYDNSESVVNMLAYILGEELLYSLESLENANERLTEEDIESIKEELKEI